MNDGPSTPSAFRVVRLVVALEARRWLNRRPLRKRQPRGGTTRKGAPAATLLVLVSLVLSCQVAATTTNIVHRVAVDAERRADPEVAFVSGETLRWIDLALELREHAEEPPEALLHDAFEASARSDWRLDEAQRAARVAELQRSFDAHGRAGFRESRIESAPWPSTGMWFHGGEPRQMLAPLSVVAMLLALSSLLQALVGGDRDLARMDARLEWWSTFPVPTRSLLLARLLGSALISPVPSLLLWPFHAVVFWCAGLGPWLGSALGLLATLYLGLLGGSLRVVGEATLRRWLAPRSLVRLQAALELVSLIPILLTFVLASKLGPSYASHFGRMLPGWLLLNPLCLPLAWLLEPPLAAWLAGLASVLVALLAVLGAIRIGERMMRGGLIVASDALQGRRGGAPLRGGDARSTFAVIARHEWLAVARVPFRLVRVLLLPALTTGLLALSDPQLFQALIGEPRHASAAAFAIGTLTLIGGALVSFANEGPALWLLHTLPCSLEGLLIRRALFWSALAVAVATACLALLSLIARDPRFLFSADALLTLSGLVLYGFVTTALGVLGTDVFESERTRRLQPFVPQLTMLLAGMFVFALYSSSPWVKFVQVTLSCLFAFALWQKVRDHAPYFLDPTEAPPARIAVADGIFAAMAFFVLQGLLGALFASARLPEGMVLLLSFAGAGLLVTMLILYGLRRMGVPRVLSAVGVWSDQPRPGAALGLGVSGGLLAGALALGYAGTLQSVPMLRRMVEQEAEGLHAGAVRSPWFAVLAVVAAPLFEELIFRGVLYRGLRRSLSPWKAALFSALVFALVHPPLAFVPVFSMAVCAARVFERTQLLLGPVVVHMIYNGLLVGFSR